MNTNNTLSDMKLSLNYAGKIMEFTKSKLAEMGFEVNQKDVPI